MTPDWPKHSKIFLCMTYFLSVITGLSVLFVFNPGNTTFFPKCPFYAVTGLYCPGCGTLRGIHEILHFRIFDALKLNPLMVLILPFAVYYAIAYACLELLKYELPLYISPSRIPAFWIWSLLLVMILFWIARNVHAYPFYLLAPHY